MNRGFKLGAYVALLVFGLFSGYRLKQVLTGNTAPAATKATVKKIQPPAVTNAVPLTNSTPSSNVAAVFTNILGLAQGITNQAAILTNALQTAAVTNLSTSNAPAAATVETTPAVVEPATEDGSSVGSLHKGSGFGKRPGLGLWIGCTLAAVLGLGLLLAYDFSQFAGKQAIEVLYQDERPSVVDAEYEEAEQIRASGDPLEAIRKLREYLQNNPREIHAALRIAEIYEKDLYNPLAAALEYEVILQAKLKPDKWGWSAIHLCNLYFKLDQEDKAIALLERLDLEYGQTGAAEKARKRLRDMGLPIPSETKATANEGSQAAADSNLPPGFRRKK